MKNRVRFAYLSLNIGVRSFGLSWSAFVSSCNRSAYMTCHISEPGCLYIGWSSERSEYVCVYAGAKLCQIFSRKAIKAKEINRTSCCNLAYSDSAFICEDELLWLTFRVKERSNKWYQSSGRGVHTTTAYICRNLSLLLTFSHTFSVYSGSYGWNCLKFEYNV